MELTQPTPSLAIPTSHRLSFTGSGREYFGIWIVNLLLSIVTLGIYSAWQKSGAPNISPATPNSTAHVSITTAIRC